MISNIPLLFVMLPVLTSVIIYVFKYRMTSRLVFLTQTVLIASFIYLIANGVYEEPFFLVFGGWNRLFSISFYIDQMSMIFIGLSLFMWTVILLYSFKRHRDDHMYLFFIMFLEGVFLGLLQTNDLFNLFVFLELITVLVTILIAYKKTGSSYRAGIYYLLINTLGAMFVLLGIVFIYYVYGSMDIQYVSSQIQLHSNSNIVKLSYVLIMSGISIKAAFVPLYSWLPRAHGVAQTSVSALLSGLIVKLSLYVFIRIHAGMFFEASYDTQIYFFYIGAATGLFGVMLALVQKDLKQVLAYHTVSQIGLMMMGLSYKEGVSFYGGFLHIINHAMFKALLFLVAGRIIYHYGTKKISMIKGVFKTMPFTSILLIIGMLSISGMPFFNGYVSKSLIKYAFKDNVLQMMLYTLINIGTVASFVKFSSILFGEKQKVNIAFKDSKRYIAMILLALVSICTGIFYEQIITVLFGFNPTSVSLFNVVSYIDYALYIGLGIFIYRFVIKKDFKWIQSLRGFSMSFEDANYALILYISAMIFLMYIVI